MGVPLVQVSLYLKIDSFTVLKLKYYLDFPCNRQLRYFSLPTKLASPYTFTNLIRRTGLDKVLLKHIIQSRVQFLSDVFNEKRPSQRQSVLKVISEVLMVE